jgi:hypothetical protein
MSICQHSSRVQHTNSLPEAEREKGFGLVFFLISQLKYLNRENTKRTLLLRNNDGEMSSRVQAAPDKSKLI